LHTKAHVPNVFKSDEQAAPLSFFSPVRLMARHDRVAVPALASSLSVSSRAPRMFYSPITHSSVALRGIYFGI